MSSSYSHPVSSLSATGLQARFMGGSGQGVTVNVSNLNDNLSYSNISGIQSGLSALGLTNGTHTVTLSNLGAQFVGGERDTIGGFRVNATLTIQVSNGQYVVTSGQWAQAAPDVYDFAPLWSEHRSLLGNLATVFGATISSIVPPFGPKPFEITINGSQAIQGSLTFNAGPECFLADTPVSMWPLDVKPDANGRYDQDEVRAKIWEKPIQHVKIGDWIVSYDKQGLLIPGRVGKTFQNDVRHILNVHGLKMTPGHVTYCAKVEGEDNPFADTHVPVIDILRSDGALMKVDGSTVRAGTGAPVGSLEDRKVWAIAGPIGPDGKCDIREKGQIRLGTRHILSDGTIVSVLDKIKAAGFMITEDGQLTTGPGEPAGAFHWTFTEHLPKPEDFVLALSEVTLQDIYEANEWEAVKPKMPKPASFTGNVTTRQPKMHAGSAALSVGASPPQVPMSMRKASSQPTMSRKQRRAQEKKMRQAAKAKKVLVSAGH